MKELKEKIEKSEGDEKTNNERWLAQALELPITVIIYFDGNPQEDFINLQLGRNVDTTHLLSMRLRQRMKEDGAMKLAFDIAKELHKLEDSPYQNLIRFDSRGSLPLPVSSLCALGGSDIGTSLVGFARVALANEKKDAKALSLLFQGLFKTLNEFDEKTTKESGVGILDAGKALTPMSNDGNKGSASMLVGVANCLLYRILANGQTEASAEDYEKLVSAASATLDLEMKGNFSGPAKRKLLGAFAKEFLRDMDVEMHEGIPVTLIRTLTASTFGVEPLPKAPKKKTQTTFTAEGQTLPDINSPVGEGETVVQAAEQGSIPVGDDETTTFTEPAAAGGAPWDEKVDAEAGVVIEA